MVVGADSLMDLKLSTGLSAIIHVFEPGQDVTQEFVILVFAFV